MSAARNPLHIKLSMQMRKAQREEQAAAGQKLLESRAAMIKARNLEIQAKRAAQREEQRILREKKRALSQQRQRLKMEHQRMAQVRSNSLMQKQKQLEARVLKNAQRQRALRQKRWRQRSTSKCWLVLRKRAATSTTSGDDANHVPLKISVRTRTRRMLHAFAWYCICFGG